MSLERQQRVMKLLDSALEVPQRERAAFLEAGCGGDEPLRREVEQLLESDAIDFMRTAAFGIRDDSIPASTGASVPTGRCATWAPAAWPTSTWRSARPTSGRKSP